VTLLSASRSGQLAVLRGPTYLHHLEWKGTLAVMSPGGEMRDVLANVEGADWNPTSDDSREMAVYRQAAGKTFLEFPIGHVIYSTTGWISHMRVSPDGTMVGFLDHPVLNDSLGGVMTVDRNGVTKTLSTGWSAENGLAWSRNGAEIWFSGARAGTSLLVYAVDMKGRLRQVLSGPGRILLHDLSPEGRLLVTRDSVRGMLTATIAGDPVAHELSWLDASHQPYFSTDGKLVLFTEGGKGAGPKYSVCLRHTDGSGGIVRLGDGEAMSLSPDGESALSAVQGPGGALSVIPVGAGHASGGQPRVLERGNIELYGSGGAWLPDGRRILFNAYEKGKRVQVYMQPVTGGPPVAVLPTDYSAVFRAVSPDGRSVACYHGGKYRICPLDPSVFKQIPPPIEGLADGEQPLRWTPDGQSLYVCDTSTVPLRVFKLKVSTGERQLWREITPPDLSGLASQMTTVISSDGRSMVYGYSRVLSELFIVDR